MTDGVTPGQAASRGFLLGLAALALILPMTVAHLPIEQRKRTDLSTNEAPTGLLAVRREVPHRRANFGAHPGSPDARHLAAWVADSGDNGGLEFLIVDKRQARVWVFDAAARVQASTAALLGSARGDDSVPGIGTRPIADVKPEERTTPAGRFVAEAGRNTSGEDVLWIDYEAAVSMHRVRNTEARERRLHRLATPSAADNRISYGCINLPVAFYEQHIRPRVATQRVIVYVLPEVKPSQALFGSYRVADLHASH